MDTRTQDKILPHPVNETDIYTWTPRRPQDSAPFIFVGEEAEDDEPAPDVGGEVGKTPRLLTAWQITGLIAGGVVLAAGIAGAIYLRSRPPAL